MQSIRLSLLYHGASQIASSVPSSGASFVRLNLYFRRVFLLLSHRLSYLL